jgi:hypothetical protein
LNRTGVTGNQTLPPGVEVLMKLVPLLVYLVIPGVELLGDLLDLW